MIDAQTTELIKSKMDIYEVVSDFVSLKRSGQNYKAKSPFTQEKTPSFFVVPSKQIFKCFSTGKGGDALTFIMEVEGVSYPEALRWMANKYGIEIQEREFTDNQAAEFNARESLYILLNQAKEFYKDKLWNDEEGKAIGLSYFKERGFSEETIQNFDLGYSLDVWDAFYQDAIKKGYTDEQLEKAGLLIKNEEKKYDRFRGRVIFPIHNISGRVIAFGARILKEDKKQPKYINSPETEVYHKSHVLYGIFQAKQDIRLQDTCYLVEGYTDVISMHQAGVKNVVASSGTSLTEDQIRLISRYTNNITVLYDGDNAGIKASLRGIDMILEGGLNVRAVVFPDGEDPDSFSRKVGEAEFKKYLKHSSQDFIAFKVGLFAKEAGNDPIKRAETIREIVESISKIPDAIKRSVYVKEAADLLKMDEQVLISEQNKILIKASRDKNHTAKEDIPQLDETPSTLPEKEILSHKDVHTAKLKGFEKSVLKYLLVYGDHVLEEECLLCDYLLNELSDFQFMDTVSRQVFESYRDYLNTHKSPPNHHFFLESPDAQLKSFVAELFINRYEISDFWFSKFKIHIPTDVELLAYIAHKLIASVKYQVLVILLDQAKQELKQAGSAAEEMQALEVVQEIIKHKKQLGNELGIVVG
ncbi:DNA primase [Cytophagales bacterium LB-30]|uniref:DNA primase n=1 Tax=Shiella aurantiaca TaxID=3058365 RepID=A0ABT8F4K5_9BACT|nr:DNA primase [Shiella aurantiaca]MDN4165228.1 DNA primase [Shiella aurantiaca]